MDRMTREQKDAVSVAQELCHITKRFESDLDVTRKSLCAGILLMVFALCEYKICVCLSWPQKLE